MPSRDELISDARIADIRARIVAEAGDRPPLQTTEQLTRLAARGSAQLAAGDDSPWVSEVSVRLFGAGVEGHQVAVDQAAPILQDLQKAITWIGSTLRKASDEHTYTGKGAQREGVRKATQLFLQPQLGAGSLVFELIADARKPPTSAPIVDDRQLGDSLLDEAVKELLKILAIAENQDPEQIGLLTEEMRRMGNNVAASLDRLALSMTKNEIDLDVLWLGSTGERARTEIHKQGAQAIRDAVRLSRTEIRIIELVGKLETVSIGVDPIRIETGTGEDFRMSITPELGDEIGPLLGRQVAVRAEETIIRRESGRETRTYRLLAAVEVATID